MLAAANAALTSVCSNPKPLSFVQYHEIYYVRSYDVLRSNGSTLWSDIKNSIRKLNW